MVRSVWTRSEVVEPVELVVTTLRIACARNKSEGAIRLCACHMSSGVVGRRETGDSPDGSRFARECLGFVKRILGGFTSSCRTDDVRTVFDQGSRLGYIQMLV